MNLLVTGGCGFIGSHFITEALKLGHTVTALDNFSNSSRSILDRIFEVTGKSIDFHELDLRNAEALFAAFKNKKFDAVIHFAGLKAVGESVEKPQLYFDNNVLGSVNLLKLCSELKIKNFIFSSSATVYGEPSALPLTESAAVQPINPYGWTKLAVEQIGFANSQSFVDFNFLSLRYFNPVGAHPTGLIGESPQGTPNNLFPFIGRVLQGGQKELKIYGNDYDTQDGTGERDYIHIMDLVEGHLKALDYLNTQPKRQHSCFNLGTGRAYSVLQVVTEFEKQLGRPINKNIVARRAGDLAANYAATTLAETELKFKAKRTLTDMVRDSLNFYSKDQL